MTLLKEELLSKSLYCNAHSCFLVFFLFLNENFYFCLCQCWVCWSTEKDRYDFCFLWCNHFGLYFYEFFKLLTFKIKIKAVGFIHHIFFQPISFSTNIQQPMRKTSVHSVTDLHKKRCVWMELTHGKQEAEILWVSCAAALTTLTSSSVTRRQSW